MPGLWEFPGGKCEPGESPEQAVLRECREETGLSILLHRRRRVTTHRYPHGLIELHYFDARPVHPDSEPLEGSGFVWVPAQELPERTFPEANGPVLAELAGESFGKSSRSPDDQAGSG
ncbi:hypothetical protein BH23PLA1_BH23PLA1_39930 [soil metagenome]